MPGRSTSGFHRPGRHCLHKARSALRGWASRMKGELHPTKEALLRRTFLHVDDRVEWTLGTNIFEIPFVFFKFRRMRVSIFDDAKKNRDPFRTRWKKKNLITIIQHTSKKKKKNHHHHPAYVQKKKRAAAAHRSPTHTTWRLLRISCCESSYPKDSYPIAVDGSVHWSQKYVRHKTLHAPNCR